MIIKICGITTVDDAQQAAEAGANAIGFNFYQRSPRYLTPGAARKIADQLPATVLRVGIFVDEVPSGAPEEAGLDIVQLYGAARANGWKNWRACRVTEDFSAAALDDQDAEAFLLDAPAPGLHGGSGVTFNWIKARDLGRRIILAGGLDSGNVQAAIAAAQPWGVDACSRLESAPGRKDHKKVLDFVKAVLST